MRVGEQEGVVPGPSICFSVVSYDLKSRSFKLNINIFITIEMPRVVYIMSVGKINISLLCCTSVIRGPCINLLVLDLLMVQL